MLLECSKMVGLTNSFRKEFCQNGIQIRIIKQSELNTLPSQHPNQHFPEWVSCWFGRGTTCILSRHRSAEESREDFPSRSVSRRFLSSIPPQSVHLPHHSMDISSVSLSRSYLLSRPHAHHSSPPLPPPHHIQRSICWEGCSSAVRCGHRDLFF